ncbi:MAG: SAM-dependent chlorinase/fluorinase, partial [Bacteroidales bacterium]|nr:SAM-dependent chlorinase/fluorinase [Bacteroidales bacterium]
MQWLCLLTDWGQNDPYVAELKARLWEELPDARILDITHTAPRHDPVSYTP